MKLHDSRQLGPLVFRDPLLLCSALYFLLYFDASGFLRLGLLAAFLHECGHILVYCALLRRFPVIEVTMTGFCMRMDAPARGLSPGRLFWLAAAGPAVNFMLAGIWALRLEQELTIRGSAFWAANLLTGGVNLACAKCGVQAKSLREMIEKTAHFGYNKMTCKNGLLIGGLDV